MAPAVARVGGALAILTTPPRLDPERVVLMGFSHGGLVALLTATDWARKHARAPEHRFRGILAFYPACNGRVEPRPRIVVPLRIHIGGGDDWTPAAACVAHVEQFRADGGDVAITVYPEAPHAFDSVGSTVAFAQNVLDPSACDVVAARAGWANVRNTPDLVTSKLGALHFYQLSTRRRSRRPAPPTGPPPHAASACSKGGRAAPPATSRRSSRSPAGRSPDQKFYRTTPLKGLFVRAKGGVYHDGRFPPYAAVAGHYDRTFKLGLSAAERGDLVEYLKSL